MAKHDDDRLLEHEYDGIREYDNPLPRWWLWIFYATIILVPVYYLAPGDIGAGKGMIARYEADVAAHKSAAPVPALLSDSAIRALSGDAAVVSDGRAVFAKNCVSCHGPDGGGLIGPNLTDDAWIHGGAPSAIHATITNGVLAKGMPPWGKLLRPDELDHVAAYVVTLHGTKPANPKAPEGVVDSAPPAQR